GNVLSKSTIYAAIAFFALAFVIYLGRIYERKHASLAQGNALPSIESPATVPASSTTSGTAPASSTPAVTVPLTPSSSGSAVPSATTPAPAPTSPAASAPTT